MTICVDCGKDTMFYNSRTTVLQCSDCGSAFVRTKKIKCCVCDGTGEVYDI